MSFIKYIDVFGEDIKLRLNGKDQTKTYIGGFLTIITGIVIIIVAWLLGKDVVYRQNPIAFTETIINSNSPRIVLTNETYPMSFALLDGSNNIFNDTKMLTIQLTYNEYLVYSNGTNYFNSINIDLIPCTNKHFPNITDENILSVVTNALCINNQNITLQGYWSDSYMNYLSVSFRMCDYDLTPNACYSREDINNAIQTLQINANIFTIESSVSISNYSNPLTKYANNPYKFAFNLTSKSSQFMIQQQTVSTDSGFFTESISKLTYFSMNEFQSDVYALNNDKELINFGIYASKQSSTYYRSYIKITTIFGSMGGILKIVLILLNYFSLLFTKIQRNIDILNSDCMNNNIVFESKFNKNKIYSSVKTPIVTPLSTNKNFRIDSQSKEVFGGNLNKISIFGKKKLNTGLNFAVDSYKTNLFEIMKMRFYHFINIKSNEKIANYKRRLQIYSQHEVQIDKLFEINEIFLNTNKINLLKFLLLDRDCYALFDCIIDNRNSFDNEQLSKIEKFKNKQNKTEIELKITDILFARSES